MLITGFIFCLYGYVDDDKILLYMSLLSVFCNILVQYALNVIISVNGESFANAVVVSIFVEFVALDDFGNIYLYRLNPTIVLYMDFFLFCFFPVHGIFNLVEPDNHLT